MNDSNPVARQVNIELESVCAEGKAPIERDDGVFGCQRCAAAMREDKRTLGVEERVPHERDQRLTCSELESI